MIEVRMYRANSFTLRGERLGGHPESSISLFTRPGVSLRDGSPRDTYVWEVEVNVKGGELRSVEVPRGHRNTVLNALTGLLADLNVNEDVNRNEILEFCERLHKKWIHGESRTNPPMEDRADLAEALAEPEVRWKLIAHLKEQIDRDPEAYANDAKIMACLPKLVADLRYVRDMDEIDHGNHHNSGRDDCPCYDCKVRRGERRP